jgi:putative hydrolase of the HAD superfamily
MTKESFNNVKYWIFDLDNTLYPKSANLFCEIEVKMTSFVMQQLNVGFKEANYLRDYYWKKYGTTLAGLMREHDIDPEPYLVDVHDISLTALDVDIRLVEAIKNLSGEKIVYTNGSKFHATRVLEARGLTEYFNKIYGVENADYLPKPEKKAYQKIIELSGIDPQYSAMFEDEYKNLDVPHDLGMRTIYLTDKKYTDDRHLVTNNLTEFLRKLTNDKNGN